MCQSYKMHCECGKNSADIFFGRNILTEKSLSKLYCPECSQGIDKNAENRVWDNGWVLELDMEEVRLHAPTMEISPDSITAEWVFDNGFATWAGITPDDVETRNRERSELIKLAKTDMAAYLEVMKRWGKDRERRFQEQGWRKAR
ncbi:MAG: hypothetical protein DRH12_10710 [Deltaproteobacteria bacterium]|nr:MAG: hypothetical protein DRH12_10710 [Deltaproteobacteria bacterium]